jgi:cytosine/adenosine deaminase-related metal-dependent hydrolase
MQKWDLKSQFLEAVKQNGGFVNCHAHFDKAFYITKEELEKSMVDMEQKWLMSDDIKRNSTQEEVEERIRTGLDIMVNQGVKVCASFIDAYDAVGHKNIDAAIKVKEEYKDKIDFITMTQPLGGLNDKAARDLYEEITSKADIAGGLPSRDRPNDNENYDHLFSIAKNLGKNIHVHIDQENNPNEKDTEKLFDYVEKYGYQGKVTAVHVISVSAQEKSYRSEIYKKMADNGISVVVCPGPALGMKQLDQYKAPIHNSIANVPEMLEAGLTVGIGVDNVFDFYHPFLDGDLWVEMRMLMDACRYYKFDDLVAIATVNGRAIFGKTTYKKTAPPKN